jgi:hypothetical protein
MTATVTKRGALDMQVCVPSDWADDQVERFAETENPSGTGGWNIRRLGDPLLAGADERTQCDALTTHVHIMLDA